MEEKGILTIAVVSAEGLPDATSWGRTVSMSMDEEAKGFPEEMQRFFRTACAPTGGGCVAVVHALVPDEKRDAFAEALVRACGSAGDIGACIAQVDAAVPASYVEDMAKMRKMKQECTSGAGRPSAEGIEWVRALPIAGSADDAAAQALQAFMYFVDFLDVQFAFGEDIERFLGANAAATGQFSMN